MEMKPRLYKGCWLSPITTMNMAGMRWEAYCNGRFIKAETLAEIKQFVSHELGESK